MLRSPSIYSSRAFLRELRANRYLSPSGLEYSEEEVDALYFQKCSDIGHEEAIQAFRNREDETGQGQPPPLIKSTQFKNEPCHDDKPQQRGKTPMDAAREKAILKDMEKRRKLFDRLSNQTLRECKAIAKHDRTIWKKYRKGYEILLDI